MICLSTILVLSPPRSSPHPSSRRYQGLAVPTPPFPDSWSDPTQLPHSWPAGQWPPAGSRFWVHHILGPGLDPILAVVVRLRGELPDRSRGWENVTCYDVCTSVQTLIFVHRVPSTKGSLHNKNTGDNVRTFRGQKLMNSWLKSKLEMPVLHFFNVWTVEQIWALPYFENIY